MLRSTNAGPTHAAALFALIASGTADVHPVCDSDIARVDPQLAALIATAAADLGRAPASGPHHSLLARLLARSGRADEAALYFHRAAELPPASLVRISAARPYALAVYAGTAPPALQDPLPVGGGSGWEDGDDSDSSDGGVCDVDTRSHLSMQAPPCSPQITFSYPPY